MSLDQTSNVIGPDTSSSRETAVVEAPHPRGPREGHRPSGPRRGERARVDSVHLCPSPHWTSSEADTRQGRPGAWRKLVRRAPAGTRGTGSLPPRGGVKMRSCTVRAGVNSSCSKGKTGEAQCVDRLRPGVVLRTPPRETGALCPCEVAGPRRGARGGSAWTLGLTDPGYLPGRPLAREGPFRRSRGG